MEKILFRKLILDISLRALIITFTIGLIVWIIQAVNHLDAQNTIIYPVKKNIVHKKIMGPNHTLGIRIPGHPFCKLIANSCTLPITTTSVNRTGEPPRNNVKEILNSFPKEIDLIIEDGDLVNSASKIYMYTINGLKKIR